MKAINNQDVNASCYSVEQDVQVDKNTELGVHNGHFVANHNLEKRQLKMPAEKTSMPVVEKDVSERNGVIISLMGFAFLAAAFLSHFQY